MLKYPRIKGAVVYRDMVVSDKTDLYKLLDARRYKDADKAVDRLNKAFEKYYGQVQLPSRGEK